MSTYKDAIEAKHREISQMTDIYCFLVKHPQLDKLSDQADINPYGTGSIWITVKTREDLELAMSVGTAGQVWTKKNRDGHIRYSQTFGSFDVHIHAYDAALPPTCKIVREEISHPAREAYTETIEKIVCEV